MNQLQKNELKKFKETIRQHIGDVNSVDLMLQKIIENGINLILVTCEGESVYLQEPNATDCLLES